MNKIWERNHGYTILRPYVDACTRMSYRKFRIEGTLPDSGAVLIAPNHTNTLMDALVVLRSRHRATVFGARADIFEQKTVAAILRFLRILPMVRRRDGIRNVLRNYEVFAEVDDVLANNVPFCMFAEGRHRPMHSLLPIGKGIARIAFASAAERPTVIIPTGIDYTDFFHYRGNVVLRFGEPMDVNAFLAAHEADGEAARYQAFRDELFSRISGVITYVPDDENYEARWAEIEAERRKGRLPKWLRMVLAVLTAPFFALAALLTLPMWGIGEYLCHFMVKDAAFRNTVRFGCKLLLTPIMIIVWGLVFGLCLPGAALALGLTGWLASGWTLAALGILLFLPSYSIFYDWLNLVRE